MTDTKSEFENLWDLSFIKSRGGAGGIYGGSPQKFLSIRGGQR